MSQVIDFNKTLNDPNFVNEIVDMKRMCTIPFATAPIGCKINNSY